MEATVFTLPSDHEEMKSFIEKYDKNPKQLQTLAAMDDLLSGILVCSFYKLMCFNTIYCNFIRVYYFLTSKLCRHDK